MAPSGRPNDRARRSALAMGLSTNFALWASDRRSLSTVRPRTHPRPAWRGRRAGLGTSALEGPRRAVGSGGTGRAAGPGPRRGGAGGRGARRAAPGSSSAASSTCVAGRHIGRGSIEAATRLGALASGPGGGHLSSRFDQSRGELPLRTPASAPGVRQARPLLLRSISPRLAIGEDGRVWAARLVRGPSTCGTVREPEAWPDAACDPPGQRRGQGNARRNRRSSAESPRASSSGLKASVHRPLRARTTMRPALAGCLAAYPRPWRLRPPIPDGFPPRVHRLDHKGRRRTIARLDVPLPDESANRVDPASCHTGRRPADPAARLRSNNDRGHGNARRNQTIRRSVAVDASTYDSVPSNPGP